MDKEELQKLLDLTSSASYYMKDVTRHISELEDDDKFLTKYIKEDIRRDAISVIISLAAIVKIVE